MNLSRFAVVGCLGLLLAAPAHAGADGGKMKNAPQAGRWHPETPLLRNLPAGTVVQTRISRVELYPGGALIERVGQVEVAPGEVRLVVPALPYAVAVNSLQISGFGKDAQAGSTFLEAGTLVEARPKELVDLEIARDAVERQDQGLAQREEALQARLELLTGLAGNAAGQAGIAPEALAKMLDYAQAERMRVAADLAKVQEERAQVAPKLEALRKDHTELQTKLQRPVKHVVVEVSVLGRTKIPLQVRYFVAGPSWRPRHIARYEPETGQLQIATQAWCLQDTGEDWQDVDVSVSTTQPAAGLEAPYGRPLEVWTDKLDEGVRAHESRAVREDPGGGSGLAAGGPQRFELGKVSIPSGELGKRLPLESATAVAQVDRLAVPRIDGAVYMTLQWKNPRLTPVLAGEAALLRGSDYVGTAALPAVHPGELLTLPFGRDPQLTIRRERVSRDTDNSAKAVTMKQRFRFVLQNSSARPASLEVREQLPVPRDRSVKVSQDAGTLAATPGGKDLPAGTVLWHLDVPAGAQKVWEFAWTLVAPAGTRVLGAD